MQCVCAVARLEWPDAAHTDDLPEKERADSGILMGAWGQEMHAVEAMGMTIDTVAPNRSAVSRFPILRDQGHMCDMQWNDQRLGLWCGRLNWMLFGQVGLRRVVHGSDRVSPRYAVCTWDTGRLNEDSPPAAA